MDKFDEKVIGYESTKDILRQILDILKRPEVYKRKGISIPRGLLMESDPGQMCIRDRLCSKCELFTSKEYSYIPIGQLVSKGGIKRCV